jgi:asparagine synthase (glutamine-hydrolysing)
MRDTLSHRGPDDRGVWINRQKTLGLAHRRLSILDLTMSGHQPMSDEEGRVWVTFNGEIYNFLEIREKLIRYGHSFKSTSDTEVILQAYKEWGTECLKMFNGMFAFGLCDEREKLLFLARDRVGKKPLYYSKYKRRFSFASEIKALLVDRDLPRDVDVQALNHYLTFGYIGAERSIFKSVKKLPPAHAMIYDLETGEDRIWNYWNPPYYSENMLSAEVLTEELETLLTDAVGLRMISDVPLGAFLSGGVDSSIIVAIMSKISCEPVKTFSIGFEESKYNELPYARVVADHFKTEHREIIVKPDAFSVLPELVRQFDEPFADSSMIPTYYVSKATKEFVTVALSGDGGDELFGGYTSYLGTKGNYCVDRIVPTALKKGMAMFSNKLPDKFSAKRHLMRLQQDPNDAFIDRSTHRNFQEHHRRALFNSNVIDSLRGDLREPELLRRQYLVQSDYDFVNRLTYTDFKTYLPDDVLVKVDRASMLVSLEVRAPLLDYRIAELSFKNIPGSLKVRGLTTKYLLKKLARKILPRQLEINRKRGFTIPVSKWLRGPLHNELKDTLLNSKNLFFNKDYVERLLREHKAGADHEGRLYALLIFALWENAFLEGSAFH